MANMIDNNIVETVFSKSGKINLAAPLYSSTGYLVVASQIGWGDSYFNGYSFSTSEELLQAIYNSYSVSYNLANDAMTEITDFKENAAETLLGSEELTNAINTKISDVIAGKEDIFTTYITDSGETDVTMGKYITGVSVIKDTEGVNDYIIKYTYHTPSAADYWDVYQAPTAAPTAAPNDPVTPA